MSFATVNSLWNPKRGKRSCELQAGTAKRPNNRARLQTRCGSRSSKRGASLGYASCRVHGKQRGCLQHKPFTRNAPPFLPPNWAIAFMRIPARTIDAALSIGKTGDVSPILSIGKTGKVSPVNSGRQKLDSGIKV